MLELTTTHKGSPQLGGFYPGNGYFPTGIMVVKSNANAVHTFNSNNMYFHDGFYMAFLKTERLSRGDYIGPESDKFENHRNVNCQHKSSGLAQGVEVNGSNTNKRSWLSNR